MRSRRWIVIFKGKENVAGCRRLEHRIQRSIIYSTEAIKKTTFLSTLLSCDGKRSQNRSVSRPDLQKRYLDNILEFS